MRQLTHLIYLLHHSGSAELTAQRTARALIARCAKTQRLSHRGYKSGATAAKNSFPEHMQDITAKSWCGVERLDLIGQDRIGEKELHSHMAWQK